MRLRGHSPRACALLNTSSQLPSVTPRGWYRVAQLALYAHARSLCGRVLGSSRGACHALPALSLALSLARSGTRATAPLPLLPSLVRQLAWYHFVHSRPWSQSLFCDHPAFIFLAAAAPCAALVRTSPAPPCLCRVTPFALVRVSCFTRYHFVRYQFVFCDGRCFR